MIEYGDEDLLMLSGIQHITFCERQWALIHIEQQWAENNLTIEGNWMHQKVDDPTLMNRNKGIVTSVSYTHLFGGLNFPITPYTMCAEIVAAADAGFGNIWSLQDCIETLYEFGNEDQHNRFIPRICAGETMSMDLTEPDAGSDLQSVMLKATFDEKENCWRPVSYTHLHPA